MKKLIYISILIIFAVFLFNESHAQKTNPAIIENVPESYAWDIVYQSFKKHNKKLNNYNKQTQTAKSGFYRYTSMLVDNRAKYQVTYNNGNIEIKFVDRQYLSKNAWVNNLLPLSKKTKKKYIYPIATTIRELKEKRLANTPPVAVFTFNPTSGSTSTIFKFDGSDSYDNEDPTSALKVRWDWENDGIWDTHRSTEKIAQHWYSKQDTFTIKMEIMDTYGLKSYVTHQLSVKNFKSCPDLPAITYKGQTYKTVLIGEQCWLKENLNVGTMIDGYENMKNNGIIEKYCYKNNPVNCEIYGGLYQWEEIMRYRAKDSTGICPEGWHIPTENDFDVLIKYLGGKSTAGEKLKEAVSLRWSYHSTTFTNISDFTALPSGIGGGNGTFNELGISAYFASTKLKRSLDTSYVQVIKNSDTSFIQSSDTSWSIILSDNNYQSKFDKIPSYKGVSVRCIKPYKTPVASKKPKHYICSVTYTKEYIIIYPPYPPYPPYLPNDTIVPDSIIHPPYLPYLPDDTIVPESIRIPIDDPISITDSIIIIPESTRIHIDDTIIVNPDPIPIIYDSINIIYDTTIFLESEYKPPLTNCPPKEYLFYFPFTLEADEIQDSLNKIASQGYKLKLGSFVLCFFEREENNSTIYPVKVLERTDIEEINELANNNWVVVNEFACTYLIKEKDPPHYEYKYCEDISNIDEYKTYLPGGENIELFNDYGAKGWELINIGGKPLFRKIKGSTVKYKYMSFILQSQDFKVLENLGKKGWQYCSSPNILTGRTGQWPVILKQRVGMGDAFSFQVIVTEDPDAEGLSYFDVAGKPEKEKQMVKSFDPLFWDLNNFGQGGWMFEANIEANEDYFGENKIVIVFQVPASCR